MNAALTWLQDYSYTESPNKKNGLLVGGVLGGGGGDDDARGGNIAAAIAVTNDNDNDDLPTSIVPPKTYKWDCNAIRQMILDFLSTKGNQLFS